MHQHIRTSAPVSSEAQADALNGRGWRGGLAVLFAALCQPVMSIASFSVFRKCYQLGAVAIFANVTNLGAVAFWQLSLNSAQEWER